MKSIRIAEFGGPEVLLLEDLPDPKPLAQQVVVGVRAVGVNPVDGYIRAGKYGPKEFPFTPGTDAAGVVEAIGPDVKSVKVGDRVYVYGSISGTYATKVLCKESQVFHLPDRFSFAQGAAIGVPYGTAYRAMFVRGQLVPNDFVLVHGASGGVGTAAVQLASAIGAKVIGSAGSEEGMKLVRAQGAKLAVNHQDPKYLEQIMAFTGGNGVDLILEMLANVNLDKDLGILAKRGRVVVIGNRGRVEIDPRQTMAKDSDIRGMSLMHADEGELKTIHAALAAGFANNSLTPIVGKEFPLADAASAQEYVLSKSMTHGKVVLVT